MRTGFWKGVLTGGIIAAAISMIAHGRGRKDMMNQGVKQVSSRAHRVLRGVSKTVNDLIK
ncbi:hypothetical protein [Pelotomaculum propionicicum]|uniref:YtxH domain-containing protein n=1 Tax=Pelotomaculum propionicicum TaxID=258475 RepID=A0A4Y7RKL7_9FIRM|nr:hypothetical protein [Pelotomaculum propionicicum]NLI12697.1 hypothetical protein [Peptococcaceae bacterium]TEB09222.1 hypothetical protein Pmgp_03301 [Pelotomaculum propionicicum]